MVAILSKPARAVRTSAMTSAPLLSLRDVSRRFTSSPVNGGSDTGSTTAGVEEIGLVTNQPDVRRGRTSREFVEATNRSLARMLGLDDVRVCYHDDGDACDCRKPKPGLILSAGTALQIDGGTHSVVVPRA